VNVLEARVVLRDRSVLDVVDLAVRFVVHYGKAYALVSAIVLPPVFLGTWGIAMTLGWGWAWTASLALSPFAAAPFTSLASRLLFEPGSRTGDAMRAATSALPRLVAIRILEALALGVGALFFLLPSIWVWALFLYANEVIVLERAPVGAGLGRLQRLLSGQSGDALMALLFLTALHIVAVFLGDVVGRSIMEDLLEIGAPPSLLDAKGSVLGMLAFWGFVPFGATCRFLLYVNTRTRTEGWDVQTRFGAIAAQAAEEGASDVGAPGLGATPPSRGTTSARPGAAA
jgi:hypothetical protein